MVKNDDIQILKKLSQLNAKHDSYCKNPESHPRYKEEWSFFWKCLYLKGIHFEDVSKYKPLWIPYWIRRMRLLQDQETQGVIDNYVDLLSEDEKNELEEILNEILDDIYSK